MVHQVNLADFPLPWRTSGAKLQSVSEANNQLRLRIFYVRS